ncbi:hypothetical protein BKA64DRAFT_744854 [Cadophora sp. MPI-SDFR-AT-0126]|nr:hypothetical protein BKA64DRAFT_744854 [Leotiomycetes sp. MPI-SDFR-AT-0126]
MANVNNGEQPAGMDDSVSPSPNFDLVEFKANLNACLKSIKSSGTFATFNRMRNVPDPGIYLKSIATSISLPLSDDDAQNIKAASHAVHSVKGGAILNDSNVWEISANALEINNDAWKKDLSSLVNTACSDLGLYMTGDRKFSRTLHDSRSTEVSAKLSKLLLYENGARPEPRMCSDSVPGIFATVFIMLPAQYCGGKITATHIGEKKVFDPSQCSASWTAWFLNTDYEIEPILTGRRLVLQYHLIHAVYNSTILAEKARDDARIAQLREIMSSWRLNSHNDQYPKTLGLKGRDYHVVSHLRDTCEEYGLSLYIAELEIEISGVRGDDDEIVAPVNGKGTEARHQNEFAGVDSDKDYVDLDEERDPTLAAKGHVPLQHSYHKTIAVIMPKSYRATFFIGPYLDFESKCYQRGERGIRKPTEITSLFEEFSSDLARNPDDVDILIGLQQICELVNRRSQDSIASGAPYLRAERVTRYNPYFSEEFRIRILSTCVDIGSKEMFLEAYDLGPETLPPSAFRSIGEAIARFNLYSLLPKVTARLFISYRELDNQLKVLQVIWDGLIKEGYRLEKKPDDVCKSWMRDAIHQAVSRDRLYIGTANHGYALACCCRKLAKLALDDIYKKLLSVVKKQIDEHKNATNTAMAFLASIFDDGGTEPLPQNLANDIFLKVVLGLAKRFKIESCAYDARRKSQQIDQFLTLFDRSYQLGLLNEMHMIVSRVISSSMDEGNFYMRRFNNCLLPILKRLAVWMSKKLIPAQDSPVRALFQGILPVHIKRFVKAEPQPPTDWARPRAATSCPCPDHTALNKFLQNSNQEVDKFIMSLWRQNHIQAAVDKTSFYTDIDRSAKKRTLIIIKNHQNHFVADHEAWQKRKDTAAANIKNLGSEAELRAYLAIFMSLSQTVLSLKMTHLSTRHNLIIHLQSPSERVRRENSSG